MKWIKINFNIKSNEWFYVKTSHVSTKYDSIHWYPIIVYCLPKSLSFFFQFCLLSAKCERQVQKGWLLKAHVKVIKYSSNWDSKYNLNLNSKFFTKKDSGLQIYPFTFTNTQKNSYSHLIYTHQSTLCWFLLPNDSLILKLLVLTMYTHINKCNIVALTYIHLHC